MAREEVPLLDLSDTHSASGAVRERFTKALGESLATYGFVSIEGHGIAPERLKDAYATAAAAFALPVDVKRQYEWPADGRQRGYTSFGVEHAKDQNRPDLKEFWHVGRDLGSAHPLHESGAVPINRMPAELPRFGPLFQQLFNDLEAFALDLLDSVERWLGTEPGAFRAMCHDGNSVLRIIHYPDVGPAAVPGAVRAAAHEDINLMTVLPVSTKPGLQILTREGRWLPVEPPPDVMVCDTGDMMQMLTSGLLPATTHRVVNPEGGSDGGRFSMPLFLHPRVDAWIRPMDPSWGPPRRAGDFLAERLREIGVG